MKAFLFLLFSTPFYLFSQDTLFNKTLNEVTVRSAGKKTNDIAIVSSIRKSNVISDGLSIEFIKKTTDVVEDTRSLFSLTNDTELYGIVQSLKVSLIENLDYLIEIQTDITDFINKIQFQIDVYKKAQRLKEIKDYGSLYYKTNFKETVNSINAIKHNGHKTPKTKIAIDFLFTDDGHVLCKRIAEKYKLAKLS